MGILCTSAGSDVLPVTTKGIKSVDISLTSNYVFKGFSNIPAVIELLKIASLKRGFTPYGLARSFCRYLQSLNNQPSPIISTAPLKPSALFIAEIYDKKNFNYGNSEIPSVDLSISPENMSLLHVQFCSLCSQFNVLQEKCYFYRMYMVLRNGWIPRMESNILPIPKYICSNGLTPDDKFYDIKISQITKYLSEKFLVKASCSKVYGPVSLTSINVAFKTSDLYRFKLISNLKIASSNDLLNANSLLLENELLAIKPRPVFDFKGSGLNELLWTLRFSNCGINDAIALIEQDDVMAIGDLQSYYTMFPIAYEFRHLMAVLVGDEVLLAARILFGISSAPAFCATYTAEMIHWLISQNIRAVGMTDDFLIVNKTLELVSKNMDTFMQMAKFCGFSFADKFQMGKVVTFLGVQIDSAKMVISFNPEKSKAGVSILSSLINSLLRNVNPTLASLNSIAGKLNDYAQVISGGRLRIRACWEYIYKVLIPDVKCPDAKFKLNLISNLTWWIEVLKKWSDSSLTGNEFPILNASVLKNHPELINCIQSDASGTDGLGFIYGNLYDLNPNFYSERWTANFKNAANPFSKDFFENVESGLDNNSHNFELEALLRYLQLCKTNSSLMIKSVLIWITDSSSAVWSVNKGYCSSEASFQTLSKIFDLLDDLYIHIVAVWVSRNENDLADNLSHLSFVLNRDAVWGKLGNQTYEFDKPSDKTKEIKDSSAKDGRQIHKILLGESEASFPDKSEICNPVSVGSYVTQQGFDKVFVTNSFESKVLLHDEQNRLVRPGRSIDSSRLDTRGSISRSHSLESKSASDNGHSAPIVKSTSEFPVGSDAECNDAPFARCSGSTKGGEIGHSCFESDMGSESRVLRRTDLPFKNTPHRVIHSNTNLQKTRTLCREGVRSAIG